MENRKFIIILIASVVLIVALTSGAFFGVDMLKKAKKEKQKEIELAYQEAVRATAGLDASSALSRQEELLEKIKDNDTAALIRTKLAIIECVNVDRACDPVKAVGALKNIIIDKSLSPQRRSEAIVVIGYLYPVSFYKNESARIALFNYFQDNSDIFGSLLGDWNYYDSKKTNSIFYNEIYRLANQIFENSQAHYMIAASHSRNILNNQSPSKEEITRATALIRDHVSMGDFLVRRMIKESAGLLSYQKSALLLMQISANHFRFFSSMSLARHDKEMAKAIKQEYETVLSLYETRTAMLRGYIDPLENHTRFHYAAFLADVYGELEKKEISVALRPIVVASGKQAESNATGIWKFFEAIFNAPPDERTHSYRSMVKLASLDADFKNLLLSLGLSISAHKK